MKKNIITVLIAIIFLLGGFTLTQDSQILQRPWTLVHPQNLSMEDGLVKCFQSTQADIVESTLSGWTKLNDRFMTEAQVTAEMDAVLKKMNIKRQTEPIKENDDETNKEIVTVNENEISYTAMIESIKAEDKGETYIVIDVSLDKDCKKLPDIRKKIQEILSQGDRPVKIDSCIIGTFEGKLSDAEMRKKIDSTLKSVKAKKVEGMDTEEMSSITAFSDSIDGFVLSNDKKINMQVALRFSEYENKTYVWIGTPLIPIEY